MKLTDKKRENIINAAIEEFQEYGFRGAKTTRIAKRASVSSRTLYNHFESKESLFDAISEMMISQKSGLSTPPFDPARDLEQQICETLERYIAIVTEPEFLKLTRVVTAEMLIDLDRSKAYFAQLASFQNPVTKVISEAMESGAIRKADPKYASRQLLGLIRDFFFTPEFMLGQKEENDGVMSDCVRMFITHYSI